MANYSVVSEPHLGRSQMAWVCKYQDFRDADGRRRTKEWIVFWEDQSLSFFRESRQRRRLYLESQGYWAWPEDGGVHLSQFSCCPARGVVRHEITLQLMAVSPGLGLWWSLWQGDQRLIIVTALVYCSRPQLERALRAMYRGWR